MRHFITNKRYFRHTSEVLLVLGILGVGLFFYEKFKFRFQYFEPYHVSSYADLFKGFDEQLKTTESAHAIPVLVYHGVLSDEEFEKGNEANRYVSTSYSRIREQLVALKSAGWDTVTYSDFEKFEKGEIVLPEKSFLLTFDDARKDSFYPVDPLLKALDYNALFFVISARSLINQRSTYYLTSDELVFAVDTGRWEIQSHGKDDHDYIDIDSKGSKGAFMSNKMWLQSFGRLETEDEFRERIYNDLSVAKKELENSLDIPITAYAFPFGDFGMNTVNFPGSEVIIKEVSKSIYKNSFYQTSYLDSDIFNYQDNDGFVKRIKGDSSYSGKELVSIFESNSPKTIPYEVELNESTVKVLKKNWGLLEAERNGVSISAGDKATSAFSTLAGSSLWKNYSFETKIDSRKGHALQIFGYYLSEENYYSCTLTPGYLRLQKKRDGVLETLKEFKLEKNFVEDIDMNFGMDSSRIFACGINGMNYSSGVKIDEESSTGQIGYRVWDTAENTASAKIVRVKVSQNPLTNLVNEDSLIIKEEEAGLEENDLVELDNLPLLLGADPLPLPFLWLAEKWEKTWGIMQLTQDGVKIRSDTKTTGGMMVLPGSQNWLDYKLSYKLDWIDGTNVVVVLRYQGNNNFLSINIHDDYIRVEELFNGKTRIIGESVRDFEDKNDLGNYAKDLDVVVRVYNNKISVFLNGSKKIETENPNRLPKTGLVGLKVWDKNRNEANVILRSFIAEQL